MLKLDRRSRYKKFSLLIDSAIMGYNMSKYGTLERLVRTVISVFIVRINNGGLKKNG